MTKIAELKNSRSNEAQTTDKGDSGEESSKSKISAGSKVVQSKQNYILDAAETLFAVHGYAGTSTRAISKKAGVNIAMLSYYFGSKHALLYAVIERFSTRLQEVIEDIERHQLSPADRLRSWICAYIDYIFENPNHACIVYRQVSVSQKKEDIVKLVSEFNKARSTVLHAIEEGINDGSFLPADPELALTSIVAPINAMVIEANVVRQRLDITAPRGKIYPVTFRERLKKHSIQSFERMLLAGKITA